MLDIHVHVVRAKEELAKALGELLAELPCRATEADAVRTVWLKTIETSALLHRRILSSERLNRGQVVPFHKRRPR